MASTNRLTKARAAKITAAYETLLSEDADAMTALEYMRSTASENQNPDIAAVRVLRAESPVFAEYLEAQA